MLTMKDIIREGHPSLETPSDPVKIPLDQATKNTLKAMREFLIASQDDDLREKYELRAGVGLAAPQINVMKRMLAIYSGDEKNETWHDYLMVNPKIVSHSVKETFIPSGEGCLSIDREVEGVVPRYHKVTVQTYLFDPEKETLKEATLKFTGFIAVVFQHELDHLNGILFPEKIKPAPPAAIPITFVNTLEEEGEVA